MALAAVLYWPGLSGSFLLDDYPNLGHLELLNGAVTAEGVLWFSSQDVTGGTGRPLSLASFALQADAWPDDPAAFKRVNLLIHLLNGCLIFLCVRHVLALCDWTRARGHWVALAVAAAWLLHPIHVPTVLYVVQRMTLLAGFFVLAGLTLYLKGRAAAAAGHDKRALAWMSLGIGLGGTLGVLSKENAVLLPLYVLALNITLLREAPTPGLWRAWRLVFLYGPLALLSLFFAYYHDAFIFGGYLTRDFTLSERVLTEARVLWDYIGVILSPNPSELGLFQDGFPISRGWFDPPTTLLAVFGVIAVLAGALALRRSLPWVTFGILWFFAGHVLESSVIGLEIYFLHRNYLPALGILIAIGAVAVGAWRQVSSPVLRRTLGIVAVAAIALTLGVTSMETRNWGDSERQALTWYQEHPESIRARQLAAGVYTQAGHLEKADRLLASIGRDWPGDSGSWLQRLALRCLDSSLPRLEVQLETYLQSSRFDLGSIEAMHGLIDLSDRGRCPFSKDSLVRITSAMVNNPAFAARLPELYLLLGRAYAGDQDWKAAVEALERAQSLRPRAEHRILQTQWLYQAEDYAGALSYLHAAQAALRENPAQAIVYEHQLGLWEQIIKTKLDEAATPEKSR